MHEVVILGIEELLEPSQAGAAFRREYVRGVTQEAVTILNGAVLLGDSRLWIDESE